MWILSNDTLLCYGVFDLQPLIYVFTVIDVIVWHFNLSLILIPGVIFASYAAAVP